MENVSNPWAAEGAETQALRSVLRTVKGHGYCVPTSGADSSPMRESTSLQLIDRLQQMSDTSKESTTVSSSVQRLLMDMETSDITHMEELESKMNSIRSTNALLQSILERKQELITRLQQPVVGDNLMVEAAYHQHVKSLFPLIAQHLAHLNQDLENINWSTDFRQTDHRTIDECLAEITGMLDQIQTRVQGILQVRASVAI